MKRETVVVLAIAGTLALACGAALAHSGGRGEVRMFGRLAERLDLSAEQRDRIREIYRDRREGALGEAARAHRAAKALVARTVHDPTADPDAIRAAVRAAAEAGEALALERHAAYVEAFRVLTPDQQARAMELRAERIERRSQRRPGRSRIY